MAWNNRRQNVPSGASSGTRVGSALPMTSYGTTISQPGQAATNLLTSLSRTRASTPAGAGVVAGHRSNAALFVRANGLTITFRFALSTFASGHRSFVGLRATAAQIGAVEPSTLTDVIGMGFDTAATQWSLLHNDGSGSCTAIALGASYNVVASDVLELRLTWTAGGNVDYRVRNLTSGAAAASGTLSTNLPSITTFLSTHAHVDTSTDATAAAQPDLVDVFFDATLPSLAT